MGSYTSKVTKHLPSGWCIYSKFTYGEVKDPLRLYRGKDCLEKFCDYIRQEANRLYHIFPKKPMDPLPPKQWKKYNKASRCHICFKQFGDSKKGPKVRDHCHYTGRYRGTAHRNCNLMYRIPSYIPVVFHNLSDYDAHLFIIGNWGGIQEILWKLYEKTKKITLASQLRLLSISMWIR